MLVEHLLALDNCFWGLSAKEVRSLAGNFAQRNGFLNPFVNEKAGKDWFLSFKKRHPELCLRTPESTSINRVKSFNKDTVSQFFNLLKDTLSRWKFLPHRIFNVDETGVQTVPQKLPKVLAKKGQRQVSKIVSAERGESVTVVYCMSPTGIFIPPFLLFPRKRMNTMLTESIPIGSKAIANGSGYMTKEIFPVYLQHLVDHTHASERDPILLLLDNHTSHISKETIAFCQANYITLLTIPPHTSHKLQPLDVAFFGPFKQRFAVECDKLLLNNAGKSINLYHVGGLVHQAHLLTATAKLAKSGFEKTGISPYNPDVFNDQDFVSSQVFEVIDLDQKEENSKASNSSSAFITPSDIRPLPKFQVIRKKHVSASLLATPAGCSTTNLTSVLPLATSAGCSTTNLTSVLPLATKAESLVLLSSRKQTTQKKARLEKICLYCGDDRGKAREKWSRCQRCDNWAHSACAGTSPSLQFICELCL
jgi:hypothetical protein